ncbi:hypothetical protein, partial [Xanthomonas phaseoli]|uniref:hypothetical protein n=1 Tax=Xanthomonas phaseoli TaxID=1985254 RepID=UPI001ADA298B
RAQARSYEQRSDCGWLVGARHPHRIMTLTQSNDRVQVVSEATTASLPLTNDAPHPGRSVHARDELYR